MNLDIKYEWRSYMEVYFLIIIVIMWSSNELFEFFFYEVKSKGKMVILGYCDLELFFNNK